MQQKQNTSFQRSVYRGNGKRDSQVRQNENFAKKQYSH